MCGPDIGDAEVVYFNYIGSRKPWERDSVDFEDPGLEFFVEPSVEVGYTLEEFEGRFEGDDYGPDVGDVSPRYRHD